MIVKTGDGKILEVIKDDPKMDDKKTRKALDEVKKATQESLAENLSKDGNKSESR